MWVMARAVVVVGVVVVVSVGGQEHHKWDYLDSSLNNTNGSSSSTTASSPSTTTWKPSVAPRILCEEARIKCALRGGCGMALQNYMLGCADLMSGRIDYCDEYCKNSLIALTSTEEGHILMDCVCSDDYCRETKARVEVCREEVVVANADSSVVSCSVAHWICSADTLCSTAIGYYDRFCRKMFAGKGCSHRCNNSISILQRQKAAAKLETCVCDGTEAFDCAGIKLNMARLCFHQFDEEQLEKEEEETNEVDTTAASKARLNSAPGLRTDQNVLWLTTVVYALISAVVRWRRSIY
ncbi:growth arrest-specific protein 1-like [Homarus americanus]|uniref:growth arrest-specific protein 1-like n=1 Tax=Homarus americanus TaxID=6706 RepID=UPI001C48DCEE|nr:growth arrest-specific protein 1-like [Homarus americanus]XP_042206232.1 growth arrest-specific protein 1-like [Homarus americanus]XP_042206233.1 growth arrest-specific protein 1-like [Homarus americanus]